ncbi:MAG: hypothetical protein WCS31_09270 [Verrucomicrobiae bacterium]
MTMRLWLLPVLLLSIVPLRSAENLSGNQKFGAVVNAHYRATVCTNGTFSFEPVNGPALNVSFVQRWVKFQRADQISLMRADIVGPTDGGIISFVFRYFWNDGEVEERIDFHPRGFAVAYSYKPFGEKSVEAFSMLIDHGVKNVGAYDWTALRYFNDLPSALDHDMPWTENGKRYSQASVRKKGGLTADISMDYGSWLSLWANGFVTTNCAPDWSKTKYRAGETYRTGFHCFLSGSNGRSLSEAPLALNRK